MGDNSEAVEQWLSSVLNDAPVLSDKQREVVFQALGVTSEKAA